MVSLSVDITLTVFRIVSAIDTDETGDVRRVACGRKSPGPTDDQQARSWHGGGMWPYFLIMKSWKLTSIFPTSLFVYFLPPASRRNGEGTVFTGICLSTPGVGYLSPSHHTSIHWSHVPSQGGGYPHPVLMGGGTPSSPDRGGTSIQSLIGGTPSRSGLGHPAIRTGWGTPDPIGTG